MQAGSFRNTEGMRIVRTPDVFKIRFHQFKDSKTAIFVSEGKLMETVKCNTFDSNLSRSSSRLEVLKPDNPENSIG